MDPSWCPGCDRLILPKRYVVPVNPTPPPPPVDSLDPEHDPNHPPPPPTPTPVPSSPEVRKKPLPAPPRHGLARPRLGGGLLHGTGRVRPGGGLKPRPIADETRKSTVPLLKPRDAAHVLPGNPTATHQSNLKASPSTPSAPVFTPTTGKKTRVVINQGPTPLYCSDECRARDLKNSFLESDSPSFSGAAAAVHQVAQIQRVEKTVEHAMKIRRESADKPVPFSLVPADPFSRVPSPVPTDDAPPPPVPPNTFVDTPQQMPPTSPPSNPSASSPHLPPSDSKNSTIRASSFRPRVRPAIPIHPTSFPNWGSPCKAALAPPTQTFLTASSVSLTYSSADSCPSSVSTGSVLFDDDGKLDGCRDGEDTCATTPSRRGSGISSPSKKKRVSFASDSKPPSPIKPPEDARTARRRRNPLLDANPLRDAVAISPKDRVKPASLPSDLLPLSSPLRPTQSSPSLVVDTPSTSRYGVAMWPEDEKRTTESARVHGALLRGYARRFAPREGRNLVWSRLWEGEERNVMPSPPQSVHEAQPDSRREYWRVFEEREAEARTRRKAAVAVQREEEERVICELLGGAGMREEDQPQARRMKPMAYDGMPGPAEMRGLTYRFDRFLYPLLEPKPTIVEKTVRRWDEDRQEWIEETTREEVYPERKKLFNFVEDH